MCFKVKSPSVANTQVTASQLLPSTEATEPESPVYGGDGDAFNKKKGRDALKIKMNSTSTGYNPVNI